MSYVQHLPPELLSYVLELACFAQAPAQMQTAALLGKVSKLWREVVFSIPAIWTSFYVSKNRDPRSFEAPLLRSGGLLVDVHVVDEATQLKAAREQLNVLAEHSSRWRNVEIFHPDAFPLLGKAIPLVLLELQSLVVKSTSQRLSPGLMYFYDPFPEYPHAPDSGLHWTNRIYPSLRCLDLCDIEVRPQDTEDFLGFLEAHSTLETLVLRKIWEFDAYIPSRTVVLPHLKELQLREIYSSEILRWVSAPNLQKLVVEKSSQLRYWTAVDIKSNYATATTVTLIHFSTAPDALLSVLRAVPLASEVKLVSTDLRSRYSFCTESILIEHKLPLLTSLHIQGVASLSRLKAVAEAYKKTLTELKAHCLDLGLPEGSFLKDYSERDEALTWLKDQRTFKFDIDHSLDASGGRYRCHEDQRCRQKRVCDGGSCQISL
ncbi:hypothetical protein M407DRAFT_22781 [Tulasnella calospora MUT 4182]|uniref:Uncharacterized protein n=1 Tax=Tulasnella calospora MUT 4182 TaxID=1051891 RepID=A0A0C3QKR3_9AGAM|nr:hypothetical protein M407DRAFT_22781 [Tulasnella calospora MUT 4182]